MRFSFKGAFSHAEDDIKREQKLLRHIRNKGVAEMACSFCKHGQMYVFGHGECDFRCDKTGEDVTLVKGRDCFEEER